MPGQNYFCPCCWCGTWGAQSNTCPGFLADWKLLATKGYLWASHLRSEIATVKKSLCVLKFSLQVVNFITGQALILNCMDEAEVSVWIWVLQTFTHESYLELISFSINISEKKADTQWDIWRDTLTIHFCGLSELNTCIKFTSSVLNKYSLNQPFIKIKWRHSFRRIICILGTSTVTLFNKCLSKFIIQHAFRCIFPVRSTKSTCKMGTLKPRD